LQIRETCFPKQMAVDDCIRPCCVTSVSKEVIKEPTLSKIK
jgi:hypothetical protein